MARIARLAGKNAVFEMRGFLFVAGFSRSGSTLLESLLATSSEVCAVGELRYIWKRGFLDNQLCGCGEEFHRCGFWNEVLHDAFGKMTRADAVHLDECFRTIHARKSLYALAVPALRSERYRRAFDIWSQAMRVLLAAIESVSGASFVVDSSKFATYGQLLGEVLIDTPIFWVHLVRDARGVAYSQSIPKVRPEIYWKSETMRVVPAWKTALQWLSHNMAAEWLCTGDYLRLRYEDLVHDPGRHLGEVGDLLGLAEGFCLHGDRVSTPVYHSISGNPSRFSSGELRVTEDRRWREKMPAAPRLIATMVAAPGLLRYGYL